MKKSLPIGLSDFKRVIEDGYAYVDKTLLIQEVIEKGTKVALIPRMRRCGKTLNLYMLRYFFEKGESDTSGLFKNLEIWKCEQYREMQGQFPVIFISLKDVRCSSWQETFKTMQDLIAREFQRHRYLMETLSPEEKEDYLKIVRKEEDRALFARSLFQLTEWLHRHHKKQVIVLIDEYDTPIHAASVGKFHETLSAFLRTWLSGGLKDNVHLERGVLTGILHIAKESLFSGMNNITTFSVLHDTFKDKCGFLESEVECLLKEYGLHSKLPDIKRWYDGYRIGSCPHIYNPWSVLNYIAREGTLFPYWVDTSDNTFMKRLIAQGSDHIKADIGELLKGGVIEKTIEEGIVFTELDKNPDAVWSLLLYSGYLTLDATPAYGVPCRLRIPNVEVAELYRSMILEWFECTIHEYKYKMLLKSLVEGDMDTFSQIFQEFLLSSVSVLDVPAVDSEKIYHAFILGMLIGLKDRYEVKSNRESGPSCYDVVLIPNNPHDLGIIMEFKKMDLETAVTSALQQIEEKHYSQELSDRGVQRILYIGFAFEGKQVLIRHKFKT